MAKKETKQTDFDLQKAIEECPKPDWYKKAFMITMDTSKIKSLSELKKQFKSYGEMK